MYLKLSSSLIFDIHHKHRRPTLTGTINLGFSERRLKRGWKRLEADVFYFWLQTL